jgi:serine O-acetyltransferase
MIAPLALLREDLRSHREGLLSQGFWALHLYRWGHFVLRATPPRARWMAWIIDIPLRKVSEVFLGISLPASAVIGRRVVIEHFGFIIVHGDAVIGDDCLLRQGVTIGNRRIDEPDSAPIVGNRVRIGAGAKILGRITIGDDVDIGANAVVLSDVPDGYVAVGVPASHWAKRGGRKPAIKAAAAVPAGDYSI